MLSLAVLPFMARYPRALARLEERQAAILLLDAQLERTRYGIASGDIGLGDTALLQSERHAGGIVWAACRARVTACTEPGLPKGLWRVSVTLAWRGGNNRRSLLTRNILVPEVKGDGQ
jgi:hypothetical protein